MNSFDSSRENRNSLFHRIGNSYGHFFNADHFMGRNAFDDNWMTKASYNVKQPAKAKGYEVSVALPGFNKEEIEVQVIDRMLQVKAIASQGEKSEGEEFIHLEFNPKYQERSFELPVTADSDHIDAVYRNGLLTIHIPFDDKRITKGSKKIEVI